VLEVSRKFIDEVIATVKHRNKVRATAARRRGAKQRKRRHLARARR
jgi:hypothetical protein